MSEHLPQVGDRGYLADELSQELGQEFIANYFDAQLVKLRGEIVDVIGATLENTNEDGLDFVGFYEHAYPNLTQLPPGVERRTYWFNLGTEHDVISSFEVATNDRYSSEDYEGILISSTKFSPESGLHFSQTIATNVDDTMTKVDHDTHPLSSDGYEEPFQIEYDLGTLVDANGHGVIVEAHDSVVFDHGDAATLKFIQDYFGEHDCSVDALIFALDTIEEYKQVFDK